MNPRPALFDIAVRRSIEDEIQRLIDLLDHADPDADLEPDLDPEPGTWTEFMQSRQSCKIEDESLEDGGDDEPWLGRLECLHQGAGTYGNDDDREDDHAERFGIGDGDGLQEQLAR